MSFTDRLKKLSHQPGLIATAALAGTLVAGKITPAQDASQTPNPAPQTEVQSVDGYSDAAFAQKYGAMFDMSGPQQAVQGAKNAIWQMSRTPEGKTLLDDLSASQRPTKISFSDKLDANSYGSANQKRDGFPIELNSNLANNSTKLTTTLFHELCHVRQYQQGVGRVSDLPEHKNDLSLTQELEARFLTSQMASHLPRSEQSNINDASKWMDKSLVLDGQVYNAVRNGLSSQGLTSEQADRQAKTEVLQSMISGKNSETVSKLVPEQMCQQFESTNQEWLHTYSMVAAAHAYDDPYPTMTSDGKRATELVGDIADRLGVDKESLLSPTGTDLKNVQKDNSGNILSADRVSRGTQENQGSIHCTYDAQDRPLTMTELNPDSTLKRDRTYSYDGGELPTQMQEKSPNSLTTVDYAADGTRSKEVREDEVGKTTTLYEAGQIARTTEQNAYGIAESSYKDGQKTDYVYKANDGTVIDEFHQSDIKPPNIPTTDTVKTATSAQSTILPLQKGASR